MDPSSLPPPPKIEAVELPLTMLPPPPVAPLVEAYRRSDDVLLTPELRSAFRGYNRDDVHRALDSMRKRIVLMRADLERAQAFAALADEIVTQARLTSAEMLADATLEANRTVADAQALSQQLLDETQQKCQDAARRGISAAFEMAGMLGYTDTRQDRLDNAFEQDAFDRFFGGDDVEADAARAWMVAS
jgi:hypothetical protein